MNRKKRRKLTAYLLALVIIFSCFGQSTGMAADYQAESKSAAVQSGESEIATGDAVQLHELIWDRYTFQLISFT